LNMSNNTQRGRNDLLTWEQAKPDNYYKADANLQNVLRRYLGTAYDAHQTRLLDTGADVATVIDRAAKLEDRIGNHPRLERWSGLGERIEQIEFAPYHDEIGRKVWQSGVMAVQGEAGNSVLQMGLYYLLGHNGEAGYMCSLACTSGLIRALQQAADDDLRDKYLPPLLDPTYDTMQHGAQFLTEVQGGSDVGANAVIASAQDDGTWRINGEKWFCSNINAQQFLMTARASDADGTRGLGLFLVPRTLDDGTTNGFHLRRLKDKLGTRTLASAELDFVDAVAYPVGVVDRGFKTVVELVLNTSRLMNAVACVGMMRRAYIEAGYYACHRKAFGNSIANYPMVQEAVTEMMSEYYAGTASSFYLAHLLDKIETGRASTSEQAAYRMLVNINKYITSIRGTHSIHRAIEVLGGNGAIESFSILPRLYRDMIVLESWEGTHNVLCVQVLRDIMRYQVHEGFLTELNRQLATVTHPDLQAMRNTVADAMQRLVTMLDVMQEQGNAYAQAHARRMVDWAAYTAQAVLLLAEAQWELANERPSYKVDVTQFFINQHLTPDYDPMSDDHFTERLERLMIAL
jgi:acyl-CoA dehydrogenase